MQKILIVAIIFLLSGCAHVDDGPFGFIVTSTKIGQQGSTNPHMAGYGEACAHSILGWFAFGDASVEAAAGSGRLRMVTSVNHENFAVLGIYARQCVQVRGNP